MLNTTQPIENLFYQGVKITSEMITTEDFIDLPEVFCQRDTQTRAKHVARILNQKPVATHLSVELAQYPNGDRFILNGNTRAFCWRQNMSARPTNLYATVYHVANNDEARRYYESIDSSNSVENSKHKSQSAAKVAGFDFKSDKLRTGQSTSAIRFAIERVRNKTGFVKFQRDISSMARYFEYYKEELLALDEYILHNNPKISQSKMCAFLLASKAYGANNQKLMAGLHRWLTNDGTINNRTPKANKMDGIAYMVRELSTSRFATHFNSTNGEDMTITLEFYLYLIDLYMEDKLIANLGGTRVRDYYAKYTNKHKFPIFGE
jgi:hypothetical protein